MKAVELSGSDLTEVNKLLNDITHGTVEAQEVTECDSDVTRLSQGEVEIEGVTIESVVGEEEAGAVIESVVHDFTELIPDDAKEDVVRTEPAAAPAIRGGDDVMMEVTVEENGSSEEVLSFTTKDIREKNQKLLDYIKVSDVIRTRLKLCCAHYFLLCARPYEKILVLNL